MIAPATRSYVASSVKSPATYESRCAKRLKTLVDLLTRVVDGLPRMLPEVVDSPVVHRNPDDRALQESAPLQPVEGTQGHHLGQVAGDPEDDKDVGLLRGVRKGFGVRHVPSLKTMDLEVILLGPEIALPILARVGRFVTGFCVLMIFAVRNTHRAVELWPVRRSSRVDLRRLRVRLG